MLISGDVSTLKTLDNGTQLLGSANNINTCNSHLKFTHKARGWHSTINWSAGNQYHDAARIHDQTEMSGQPTANIFPRLPANQPFSRLILLGDFLSKRVLEREFPVREEALHGMQRLGQGMYDIMLRLDYWVIDNSANILNGHLPQIIFVIEA